MGARKRSAADLAHRLDSMNVQPYRWDLLPKIPRAVVAVLERITGHAGFVSVPHGEEALGRILGVPVRLRQGTIVAVKREEMGIFFGSAPRVFIGANVGERRLFVTLESSAATSLCRRLLGGGEEMAAPRPLTPAEEGAIAFLALVFAEAACRDTDDSAGEQAARQLFVHGVTEEVQRVVSLLQDPWGVTIEVHAQIGDLTFPMHVIVPESLVMAPPRSSRQGIARIESCVFSLRVVLGRGTLPAEQVAALGEGDVVLLDGMSLHPARGGRAWLWCGGLEVPLDVGTDGTARVAGEASEVPHRRKENMAENESVAVDEGRLAALEVEVVAEMGRVVLSGREIARLTTGSVVQLGRPLGGPVDLVAGGKLIARGELVDVEGEIGVRIIEMLGPG